MPLLGIHRGLGVHISKVKSVMLDTWVENEVVIMEQTNNEQGRSGPHAQALNGKLFLCPVNALYEAGIQSGRKINAQATDTQVCTPITCSFM